MRQSVHHTCLLVARALMAMLFTGALLHGSALAQEPADTTPSPVHTDTVSPAARGDVYRVVDHAARRAEVEAWTAGEAFRQGQRATLRALDDPGASTRLARHLLHDAVTRGLYQGKRQQLEQWKPLERPAPAAIAAAPDLQEQARKNVEDQEARALAAKLALEEARRREAAEQDIAQKALLRRKREIAEEKVTWTDVSGKAQQLASDTAATRETAWSEFADPLAVDIDALSDNLTQAQRQERVDPLMQRLIAYRRELWQETSRVREDLTRANQELLAREDALTRAQEDVAALQKLPPSNSALRALRVEVHQAELALAQDRHAASLALVTTLGEHLERQNTHVEESSMMLRRVLPLASRQARSEFYDLASPQNWRDARDLLRDRVQGWRARLTQRWLTASAMDERLMSVLLWVLALLPRLFLFVLVSVVLRFIPALLRRLLDVMLRRAVFRRNPGWAIKIYEVSRISFKPALFFWVSSVIFDYVLLSFPEAIALWGAIEAVFVFWLVDRVARTLFYARARREKSGYASSGEIDDLTPTEASMADVFLLEREISERAVRSTRSVALLVIAWTWALDLLHALVGYSVISYLVEWALVLAIFGLVFVLLSRWRTEIAMLFGRMLGARAPKAQEFVERHKDRPWGVAVIAGAASVVLIGETFNFVRRYVLNTQIFATWNNFFFARKVELQSRLEERRFEPANLTPAQRAPFLTTTPQQEEWDVDRGFGATLEAHYTAWESSQRQGSVICTGEQGVGVSTLLGRFARAHDLDVHTIPHDAGVDEVMAFLGELFNAAPEALDSFDEFVAWLDHADSRTIIIDDVEHLFVRNVGGYDAVKMLTRLVGLTDHRHFWVLGCARPAWLFLQKVAELNQHFGHELELEPWHTAQLREFLIKRTASAGITVTFQSLDSNATGSSVVKTEEGYFRYLKDFVRGNAAAALHYWCQSMCVETLGEADFSIQLFDRKHAQQLTKLGDKHTFMLSALVHYGTSSIPRLSEAMNLSPAACRTLLDRLDDMEVIAHEEGRIIIQTQWVPLVIRYLSDSNLLIS